MYTTARIRSTHGVIPRYPINPHHLRCAVECGAGASASARGCLGLVLEWTLADCASACCFTTTSLHCSLDKRDRELRGRDRNLITVRSLASFDLLFIRCASWARRPRSYSAYYRHMYVLTTV